MGKRTVLYIGKFFPRHLCKTILKDSKYKIGFSNHNFEMSIISGLIKQEDIELTCVSCPGVYTYPYNNKRILTKAEKYVENDVLFQSVGFCNIPILNKINQVLSLIICLLKYYNKHSEIEVIINPPNFYLMLGFYISKVFTRKIKSTTLIIPDIPSMITALSEKQTLKSKLVHIMDHWSLNLMNKIDQYVLLTDAMKDFIKKDSIKYIVMEGLVDVDKIQTIKKSAFDNGGKNIILYTGTLFKVFGIMNLIDAYIQADLNNTELWICGSGEASLEIKEIAETHKNIKFYGLVSSEEAMKLQKQATILVNPRTSQGEYTKYSFPSKTIEYLLSGKVVVANKLPGIPEEYYDYIITPKNESIEELAETLKRVVMMKAEEREQLGECGCDFIIKNKNSKIQTRRILDMN